MSEAENRFLEPVFVRGMDRTFDDIVVHQPVDDIGTLAFNRTDHQRVPEQPALINEAVGADALQLAKVLKRLTGVE